MALYGHTSQAWSGVTHAHKSNAFLEQCNLMPISEEILTISSGNHPKTLTVRPQEVIYLRAIFADPARYALINICTKPNHIDKHTCKHTPAYTDTHLIQSR